MKKLVEMTTEQALNQTSKVMLTENGVVVTRTYIPQTHTTAAETYFVDTVEGYDIGSYNTLEEAIKIARENAVKPIRPLITIIIENIIKTHSKEDAQYLLKDILENEWTWLSEDDQKQLITIIDSTKELDS
tara:strand:- start:91 stop:483 length:393 start_codon:yes stop_codon:yes gene_type:complete